jgi:hypothetical protein
MLASPESELFCRPNPMQTCDPFLVLRNFYYSAHSGLHRRVSATPPFTPYKQGFFKHLQIDGQDPRLFAVHIHQD